MRLAVSILSSGWLTARGAAWVERRREVHRPLADPLARDTLGAFGPYFEAATLDAVRVHWVPRIDPPWPVALWGRRPWAVDFGHVWGITYVDTVVLATEVVDDLRLLACLFHECVHVAQYRLYGSTGFVRRYVREWMEAGWRYRDIGLEREAYTLQRRFSDGGVFRVEEELRAGGLQEPASDHRAVEPP